LNDVLISVFSSVITVGGLWVLLKNTLIESVGKTITYKFDKKLQDNQKLIDIELKIMDSQLSSNGAQVEALVSSNLTALDFGRQKQIDAIEILWIEMMQLRQLIPGFVTVLELMPSEFHEQFIDNMNIEKDLREYNLDGFNDWVRQSKARSKRVFSSELMYSYYELYQSVITMCLMHISVEGLDGKFSNWYEKYNIAATFSNPNVNFEEVEGKLGKTQHLLSLIEKNFLSDAKKVINGEIQMYESDERAKKINKLRSQLIN